MGRQLCVLLVCVATLPLFCQTSSPKPQVGTITAVNVHRSIAQTHDSDALQYDVSLKVGNTIYMVLYTPPSSSKGVEYALGQNVIVLIGSKSITFTKFGKTFEVPILSREILPIKTGIDWSRAPGEYFSQKLQHLSEILDLTADQQTRIRPILEQEAGEAGQITTNPVLSSEEKLNKLEKIVRASDQKLKPILSADQRQTLQNMRKEQKREMRDLVEAKAQAQ